MSEHITKTWGLEHDPGKFGFGDAMAEFLVIQTAHSEARKDDYPVYMLLRNETHSMFTYLKPEVAEEFALAILAELRTQGKLSFELRSEEE